MGGPLRFAVEYAGASFDPAPRLRHRGRRAGRGRNPGLRREHGPPAHGGGGGPPQWRAARIRAAFRGRRAADPPRRPRTAGAAPGPDRVAGGGRLPAIGAAPRWDLRLRGNEAADEGAAPGARVWLAAPRLERGAVVDPGGVRGRPPRRRAAPDPGSAQRPAGIVA